MTWKTALKTCVLDETPTKTIELLMADLLAGATHLCHKHTSEPLATPVNLRLPVYRVCPLSFIGLGGQVEGTTIEEAGNSFSEVACQGSAVRSHTIGLFLSWWDTEDPETARWELFQFLAEVLESRCTPVSEGE